MDFVGDVVSEVDEGPFHEPNHQNREEDAQEDQNTVNELLVGLVNAVDLLQVEDELHLQHEIQLVHLLVAIAEYLVRGGIDVVQEEGHEVDLVYESEEGARLPFLKFVFGERLVEDSEVLVEISHVLEQGVVVVVVEAAHEENVLAFDLVDGLIVVQNEFLEGLVELPVDEVLILHSLVSLFLREGKELDGLEA